MLLQFIKLCREIMGKRYIGEIKDKETAKKQYDQARQRGQSAGHVGMK